MAEEKEVIVAKAVEVAEVGEKKPEVVPQLTAEQIAALADKKPEPKMVPEAVIIELKKEMKRQSKGFESKISELESKISKGTTDSVEVSEDLAKLGEEYGVDKEFLGKLALVLKAKADATEKPEPVVTEKERSEVVDTLFEKHYNIALEKSPEFANIANRDVIKSLSLLPANANKTFSQILEETYGNAVSGKRTIDSAKPGGGKDPEPLDYLKAKKDSKYFDEVMADPALKAEYNKRMLAEGI